MAEFARVVGYLMIAAGVVMIVIGVNGTNNGSGAIFIGGGLGLIMGSALYMVLAGILDHLENINNRLTWLMPPEYFEANPDEKPESMQDSVSQK